MILRSEYSLCEEPPVQDFPSLMFETMQIFADRTWLIDSVTGKEYTFRYCYQCCRKIGQALYKNHGLRKGDIVLLFTTNCPEYILFAYGAASIGVVLTMANPLNTVDEIVYHLRDAKAKIIFTSQEQCVKVQRAAELYGRIQEIFVLGGAPNCVSYASLLDNEGDDLPIVTFNPKNDVLVMPYSSGTTGRPKGVMLSHWNVIANNWQITSPDFNFLSRRRRESVLIYLPLYHTYGFVLVRESLLGGHTAIIMPKFDLKKFTNIIKKYKVSTLPMVPPTVVQITKNPSVLTSDFDSVHTFFYGAAPLALEVELECCQKFPRQELRRGYGMTEMTAFIIRFPAGVPMRPGSSGKLIPDTEARFVDPDTGKDVGVNQIGELWVRGPQLMKGYVDKPKETADTIDQDGFCHTGDIAYYDKDGYIYIVDRIKELIKFKGLQVSPTELEGLILSHEAVADCAVVPVPDIEAGELPRAYVVLKPGHRATEKELTEFVSRQVAPHKRLRAGVRFVEKIPRSPSGKILRRVIKEQIRNEVKLNAKM